MFPGESKTTKFEFDEIFINDVLDWFGTDVELNKKANGKVQCTAKVNQMAMKYWALQYSSYVTVTEPKELVREIEKTLKEASKRYKEL